jgi:hypothetical protein
MLESKRFMLYFAKITWNFAKLYMHFIYFSSWHENLSKVGQNLSFKFPKFGSQKILLQAKNFGFNETLYCFISFNTKIFSYEWILHSSNINAHI